MKLKSVVFLFLGITIASLLFVTAAIPPEIEDTAVGAADSAVTEGLGLITSGFSAISSFLENTSIPIGDSIRINVFIFVILLMIIYSVVDSAGFLSGNKVISIAASFAITFITVIAIPDGFISVILPAQFALLSFGATVLFFGLFFLVFFVVLVRMQSLFFGRLVSFVFGCLFLYYFFATGVESGIFKYHLLIFSVIFFVICLLLRNIRRFVFNAESREETERMIGRRSLEDAMVDSAVNQARNLADAARQAGRGASRRASNFSSMFRRGGFGSLEGSWFRRSS